MVNQHGFMFGFEIEVNNIGSDQAGRIVRAHPYWRECPDGGGWEFKTAKPFTDLDEFMVEVRALIAEFKTHGADVSNKGSPRGIHIHVSHPTRVVSEEQPRHALALKNLWSTNWRARQNYCVWRVATAVTGRAKYSAINAHYDGNAKHLEIRAYNATLNMRAISQMLLNAQKVANIVFADEGRDAYGKRLGTSTVRTPRPRRARRPSPLTEETMRMLTQ